MQIKLNINFKDLPDLPADADPASVRIIKVDGISFVVADYVLLPESNMWFRMSPLCTCRPGIRIVCNKS